jgi:hypothetical protein
MFAEGTCSSLIHLLARLVGSMKKRVYIETTIPSYLTAWPSKDLIRAAEQKQTSLWWEIRDRFELVGSELLIKECSAGDASAAKARIEAIKGLILLEQGLDVVNLANLLIEQVPLPDSAVADAMHIALAAVHGVDLLLTWNCRHISNPILRPRVESICRRAGYQPPSICSPTELLGES